MRMIQPLMAICALVLVGGAAAMAARQAAPLAEFWIGEAPACNGLCVDCESLDMDCVRSDRRGDGARCLIGTKVLCRARPMPVPESRTDDAHHLRVLTYNIFVRPFFVSHDGQRERTHHIPRAIAQLPGDPLDVVVIQEAFDEGRLRAHLLGELARAGFPYHTELVRGGGPFQLGNGGVFIASRWPIERSASRTFQDACSGTDCLAPKGVMYARIRKTVGETSAVYHVFGTHLQSGTGAEPASVRIAQLQQMARFRDSLEIPADEPVVLAGDFNVDAIADPDEVVAMLRTLGAELPTRMHLGEATSDPRTNALVGQSGDADEGGCRTQYMARKQCPCCRGQHLDYVLTASQHRQPQSASAKVLHLKADRPFQVCMSAPGQPHFVYGTSMFCRISWDIADLSDHYPVMVTLQFPAL
jgi:endonuclease/exonuclease/phosphatase family metal-dependent hydrolase